jgi:hypothetical protein
MLAHMAGGAPVATVIDLYEGVLDHQAEWSAL